MLKFLLPLCGLALLSSVGRVEAQPRRGTFIDGAVGLGYSFASDNSGVRGQGGFAEAELVWAPTSWFGARPYAAVVLTWPDGEGADCETSRCEVTANILAVGGKLRLAAPIPFIAPFIELGVGLSIGELTTRTPTHDSETMGAAPHIPVTLGLALGSDHTVELALAYYFHPSEEQVAGAFAVGMSFMLAPPARPARRTHWRGPASDATMTDCDAAMSKRGRTSRWGRRARCR